MMSILTILWLGLMNRLRGYDPSDYSPTMINHIIGQVTNKFVTSTLSGVPFYFITGDWVTATIIAIGILIWSMPGWGDYFDFESTNNNEQKWIDKLTASLTNPQVRDTVSMSLRGLYLYPTFIALGLWHTSFLPVLAGLGLIFKGPIYWFACKALPKFGYNHALAETLTGFLFGLLFIIGL